MARYFISDLHLQPSRMDLAKGYYDFCEQHLSQGDELYILGDFFDAWIGDDEDGDFYKDVIQQLAALKGRGVRTYFMHGNRDFLVGDKFAELTGATLLEENCTITLTDGRIALLLHGDSLCTDDIEYMAFRQQVRNPAWQAQILALPLEHRRAMAADLRAKSKSMNSNKAEDIMDVAETSVNATFEKANTSLMIHGHTHRPNRHKHTNSLGVCERIVLGDWEQTGWYLKDDNSTVELVEFPL
ncbi:UDP-2,3-diacylglucosamine diphosphatase [Saccharophagus degradans]|uniref:UDP-2,3-diacylglucosamine diphosphatase n=1 Tax=Saccharophagus degradans TaxID=86304 RepID=UPI002477CE0C|nr:UDP-2,3-diacylglucosamine diphosphatase [Saccharophagus degradans]WGO96593.1 UDP-2,3-diacylglucosamine diphosphatase [Saccharophagus degradans]